MATPKQIDDGNWSTRQPMSIEYVLPFSEVGDTSTFKAKATYRQDKVAYRSLVSMTQLNTPYGSAYLTKAGDTKDIGCGLYEFTDEFCSLPVRRTEYGSFSFTFQIFELAGTSNVDPSKYFYDVTYDLEEQTFTAPSSIEYEYSLNSPLPPLLKPRLIMLFGRLQYIGGVPPKTGRMIAEDSQVTIYAGKIFQRRTIYVNLNPTNVT